MFDSLTSARALMGMSLSFHIVFTAIGIGIPVFFLAAEGLGRRTGNPVYIQLAKRWARISAVLFAVGAVSGTILSFEFGLLWPTWMDFSGAIIGLPFTLEGFAFFTEAIFLALYIYGWDRLSPRMHMFSAVVVAISSAASAFFVISANGWMNQPAGFEVIDGKAVNIDPMAAIFNAAMPYQVVHGTIASYVATGFAIAAVYAYRMLRGNTSEYVRKGLMLGMVVGAISVPLQIIGGDLSARFLAHNQPEKFAAMEAQFETESRAPLRIGGIPDPGNSRTRFAIELPGVSSFLAFEDVNAEVRGLNSFPQDEIPDVHKVHYSFQVMVAIGSFLLLVAGWFWVVTWRRKGIMPGRWLLMAIVATFPMGFIAIETGWYVTEFGRQPWIIYQLMRTSEAATPRDGIFVLFLVFLLVYILLAVGLILLLFRVTRRRSGTDHARREVPDVA